MPSPLTGEGEGGGEQIDVYSASYQFPLPPRASPEQAGFIPSARGGEGYFRMNTNW